MISIQRGPKKLSTEKLVKRILKLSMLVHIVCVSVCVCVHIYACAYSHIQMFEKAKIQTWVSHKELLADS